MRWHFTSDRVPDDVVVNREVAMDQRVLHPCQQMPFDLWMRVAELDGEALRRLANDLQAPCERSLEDGVAVKLLPRERGSRSNEEVGLVKDVLQARVRQFASPSQAIGLTLARMS